VHLAAHTSPVYLDGATGPVRLDDLAHLARLLEGGIAWLETLATPASPDARRRLRGVFDAALVELEARRNGAG
jgi:hypothetical protein